jgi:maltose alpha-D-glucosyltransferase/alpha-amylase
LLGAVEGENLEEWKEIAAGFVESARALGRRTAEMHAALSSYPFSKNFSTEPFGKLYQRSVYQTMRNQTGLLCRKLQHRQRTLAEPARELAARVLALEGEILRRFRGVLTHTLDGFRIRIHGDYHLGRLLYTGKDFVVSDFEGEPGRTVEDRRVKRSPLRDVATMIRSLDYAVHSTLLGLGHKRGQAQGVIRDEDIPTLGPWGEAWYHRGAREFTTSYMENMLPTGLLPSTETDRRMLLELFLLERAIAEVETEMIAGNDRIVIPLRGILRILEADQPGSTP